MSTFDAVMNSMLNRIAFNVMERVGAGTGGRRQRQQGVVVQNTNTKPSQKTNSGKKKVEEEDEREVFPDTVYKSKSHTNKKRMNEYDAKNFAQGIIFNIFRNRGVMPEAQAGIGNRKTGFSFSKAFPGSAGSEVLRNVIRKIGEQIMFSGAVDKKAAVLSFVYGGADAVNSEIKGVEDYLRSDALHRNKSVFNASNSVVFSGEQGEKALWDGLLKEYAKGDGAFRRAIDKSMELTIDRIRDLADKPSKIKLTMNKGGGYSRGTSAHEWVTGVTWPITKDEKVEKAFQLVTIASIAVKKTFSDFAEENNLPYKFSVKENLNNSASRDGSDFGKGSLELTAFCTLGELSDYLKTKGTTLNDPSDGYLARKWALELSKFSEDKDSNHYGLTPDFEKAYGYKQSLNDDINQFKGLTVDHIVKRLDSMQKELSKYTDVSSAMAIKTISKLLGEKEGIKTHVESLQKIMNDVVKRLTLGKKGEEVEQAKAYNDKIDKTIKTFNDLFKGDKVSNYILLAQYLKQTKGMDKDGKKIVLDNEFNRKLGEIEGFFETGLKNDLQTIADNMGEGGAFLDRNWNAVFHAQFSFIVNKTQKDGGPNNAGNEKKEMQMTWVGEFWISVNNAPKWRKPFSNGKDAVTWPVDHVFSEKALQQAFVNGEIFDDLLIALRDVKF